MNVKPVSQKINVKQSLSFTESLQLPRACVSSTGVDMKMYSIAGTFQFREPEVVCPEGIINSTSGCSESCVFVFVCVSIFVCVFASLFVRVCV